MKTRLIYLILLFALNHGYAQQSLTDSLNHELNNTKNDTLLLALSNLLSWQWLNVNSDSSIQYAEKYLKLTQKLDYSANEADALSIIAYNNIYLGNYPKALETLFKALKILEIDNKNTKMPAPEFLEMMEVPENTRSFKEYSMLTEGFIHSYLALLYWIKEKDNGRLHAQKASQIAQEIESVELIAHSFLWKSISSMDKPDTAVFYAFKARDLFLETRSRWMSGACEEIAALAYHNKGDHESELIYLKSGLYENFRNYSFRNSGWSFTKLSDYFLEKGNVDSVIYYANKALSVSVKGNYPDIQLIALKQLSNAYKSKTQKDSLYKYLQLWIDVKNKSLNSENIRQFENVQNNQMQQERELIAAQERYQNKLKFFGLLAGLSVLLIVTIVLLRNNKQKKKANAFLQHKNEEIETQKNLAEKTLLELKSTQAQLIQAEKMASLGELTAGIAHEIQNPLNFVNNFSEVSNELIDEMKEELAVGTEASVLLANEIADNIKQNLEKINHHGKRADAIVKGMLQHSRNSSGQKELTDINTLADEYLRLAFHGLRAKDKSFNADIKTEFDEKLPKINVVPQEIGRVLLNLFNNAFYAVQVETKNSASLQQTPQNQPDYKPMVIVSTKNMGNHVELRVKDNGPGIPDSIKDKIFQPFFTTKPTGQGTGLGLSLSYDIVKTHGGELKVETKENEGTEFIIQLPIS